MKSKAQTYLIPFLTEASSKEVYLCVYNNVFTGQGLESFRVEEMLSSALVLVASPADHLHTPASTAPTQSPLPGEANTERRAWECQGFSAVSMEETWHL